jgi:hypothetical protein
MISPFFYLQPSQYMQTQIIFCLQLDFGFVYYVKRFTMLTVFVEKHCVPIAVLGRRQFLSIPVG